MHISPPRHTRGTSIIAALVFAAILGGIALGLNAFQGGSLNQRGLTAGAGAAPAAGYGAALQAQAIQTHTATCDQILAQATSQGQETPQYSVTDKQENLKDSCNAAVINPATVQSMQQNYPGDWRFRQATYKCVGESGQLKDNGDGTFTETMKGDISVPAGKCSTQVCDTSGKCASSQLASGVTSGSSGSPFAGLPSGSGSPTVTPDQSGTNWCGNGASNPPTCDTCPTSTSMQNGICQLDGAATNPYLNGTYGTSSNPTNIPEALTPGTSGAQPGSTVPPPSDTCPTGQIVNGHCTVPVGGLGGQYCSASGCQPGQILTRPYYCMTSANPIVVQPLSAGSAFPSNCLNNSGSVPVNQSNQNGLGSFFSGFMRGATFGAGNPAMMGGNPAQQQCSFIASIFGCQNASVSCQINISPNPPQQGMPASLTWTTFGNVGFAQITGIGQVGPSGTYTVYPSAGGNYTLQIQDQMGNQSSCSTQANVIPRTGCTGNSSCQSTQTPYGVGTNGQACGQPPAPPDPSQCTTGKWQPTSAAGNGCTTGYQCVPNGSNNGNAAPTAQLSCTPQTVEAGQSVAFAYSCGGGSTTALSSAFTASGLSGTATMVVSTPPANTNTATYHLACTNAQGQTAGAECSVQINQPSIVLVANPAQVQSGQTTTIGWVTAGMQSCVVSSPTDTNFTSQNASNQSVSGMATTNPITAATEYDLTCTSIGGQTKTASTTVQIGNSSAHSVQVTSSADAKTVNHGDTITVQWQSKNAPANSAVALWLVDLHTQAASALIAGDQPTSGSYQWTIPTTGSSCDTSSPIACASDVVAGNSYGIEASVYHPANAFLGGSQVPSGAVSPTYSDSGYTPNPFSIGQ